MGILQRFSTIMASNINAMLDRAEDPSKMVDQLLRDLRKELGEVKSETAAIMAEESRASRTLLECEEAITKYTGFAEKALLLGNEADARRFLEEKALRNGQLPTLQENYNVAKDNALRMRQMYEKLSTQINELEQKRVNIKAMAATAKAQSRVNKMTSNFDGASIDRFKEMEQKAQRMLDTANAQAQLDTGSGTIDLRDLEKKYGSNNASAVDDELTALKAKLSNPDPTE